MRKYPDIERAFKEADTREELFRSVEEMMSHLQKDRGYTDGYFNSFSNDYLILKGINQLMPHACCNGHPEAARLESIKKGIAILMLLIEHEMKKA